MIYSKLFNRKQTSQSMPIPGSDQIQNNAGGYVFEVNGWTMLDRFLILGSESGTYYVDPRKLTRQNADHVIKLIKEAGEKVVERIVEVSVSGRAPKNDPAIFALALCASFGDDRTRAAALNALNAVCRTGTHLFQFAEAADGLRGWGRGLRRAVGTWYNAKPIGELELQLIKYQQRNGWSNRDLLRLAHPAPASDEHQALYAWVVKGETVPDGAKRIEAMNRLKSASAEDAAKIIAEARLPREAVPTELLTQPQVWEALLQEMPMTAMVRNLGNMTKIGLVQAGSDAAKLVVQRLGDEKRIRGARVHPMALLIALRTYAAGHGLRGSGQWQPVSKVIDALDAAFYTAFQNVEPTGKRFLLGMDVSGSMASPINGSFISAAQASAAMAMITLAKEDAVTPMAFASTFKRLDLSRRMRLDDVMAKTSGLSFGATDCALPMVWAGENRIPVDVFTVYTDSETWFGKIHPAQALRQYREKMGIDAKLIVVGMAANNFSIADPNDRGMLDVVGFDASVPEVMTQFVNGR